MRAAWFFLGGLAALLAVRVYAEVCALTIEAEVERA